MIRKIANWFSVLVVAALALAPSLAGAQTGYGANDYPVLGGTDGRPNRNGAPNANSPGNPQLSWRSPAVGGAYATPFYVDNTDFLVNNFYPPFQGGPYDFNGRGNADSFPNVTGANNSTTAWGWPAFPAPPLPPVQATGAYDPIAREVPIGTLGPDYNYRTPAYFMTACTPSAPGQLNPTIAENAGDLRYFDWNYKWSANNPPYAFIYVNIPTGATETGLGTYAYPVEYYVYEILYYDNLGNQQEYIQVVDTYVQGTGLIQLGLLNGSTGAFPVNQPPSGTNAITVRLLNTVPRDPNTGLLLQLYNGQELPSGEESLVKQFQVYADAVQYYPDLGAIYGTPTVATLTAEGATSTHVTVATNLAQGGTLNGNYVSTTYGQVIDFSYNANEVNGVFPNGGYGVKNWSYSPLETGTQVVNVGPSSFTPGFVVQTGPAPYQGANYLAAVVSNQAPNGNSTVSYAPNLSAGSYQIWAYIPGNVQGQTFATKVRVDIYEGANDTVVYVNEATANGWVAIGTRAYNNNIDGTGPLKVVISNYSPLASDQGSFVYANYVRFQGSTSLDIVATPIHAQAHVCLTPGGIPTLRDVVLAFDEKGVIHCLDATGNANGTTTEYWSYPSTPATSAGWADPNTNPNLDTNPIPGGLYDGTNGNTLAEMPSGFGYSSGIVESYPNPNNGVGQPATLEYLFVTTTNGRVYCIAMQGRGDYNATLSQAGTTQRCWTYPATYPSPKAIPSSALGAFQGSPAFGQINVNGNAATTGALFVPTMQGRMYCLTAFPSGFNAVNNQGATSVLWTYPALNQPTVGSIAVTPALDTFGGNAPYPMLFFGTYELNDNPAQFFALNADNGAVVWSYNAIFDPVANVTNPFTDFVSSPCTVSGAILSQTPNDASNPTLPTANVDTVYTANTNNYIYAFNAETGALSWQSSDLPVGVQGALSYAVVTTYDYLGTAQQPFPMIMVPATTTQRFYGEFARPYDVNYYGGHLAWGSPFYEIGQSMTGSISNADNWMYAADTGGNLYALSQYANPALGYEYNPFYPPNSPQGRVYSYAKVRIITQQEYQTLVQGNQSYQAGTSASGADTRNPVAFDYGETAYIQVYDIPYSAASTSNDAQATSVPTQANITISTQGSNTRTITAAAQQFVSGAPQDPSKTYYLDGYVVYPYSFTVSPGNSVAPGTGKISVTLTVTASNGQATTYALYPGGPPATLPLEPPVVTGWSQLPFTMANPLAVEVPPAPLTSDADQSIGFLSNPFNTASASDIGNPGDQQNSFNGSLNVTPTGAGIPPGTRFDLIEATPGQPVPHNTSGQFLINVYDRSLMALLRGPGQPGINAKADIHDIVWQGSQLNIWSPLDPTLFPNFEDYPGYPNTSLDYPNISFTAISVTANPTTAASNAVLQGAGLFPPMYDGAPVSLSNNPSGKQDRITGEVGVPTPFLYQVQVPQFQPANLAYDPLNPTLSPSETGATEDEFGSYALSQGYEARTNIYLDMSNSGVLVTTGPNADAYRGLNFTIGVPPSPSMVVTTPNVDLGAVPAGQNYGQWNGSIYNLGTQTSNGTVGQSSPWLQFNPNAGYYQQFILENTGNVNMLNLRVAKASSILSAGNLFFNTWSIPSNNNDPAGYLDSFFDLWSNMDRADAPPNPNNTAFNYVPLQKARVTDTVPTQLYVNPVARANPNLGLQTNAWLRADYPSGAADYGNIGVTVPVGLPVGNYSQLMRIVENWPYASQFNNEILDQVSATTYETYSDPSFTLSFDVVETRLTGNATPAAYPSDAMAEYITPQSNSALAYRNVQPTAMRDPFGGLIAFWVSDRPDAAPNVGPSATPNPSWKIYAAGLGNQAKFAGSAMTPPVNPSVPFSAPSPLFDIDWFTPSSQTQWFNPSPSTANGYPSGNTASLFPGAPAGQTINNVSFGSPSLPADGMVDKLSSQVYSQAIMGFVGEAQLSPNGAGAANASTGSVLSALYLASVQTTAGTGAVTIGNPVLVAPDYSIQKGKPAIVQRSNTTALVFYPGTSANASDIYYTLFNGTAATPPYPLNFGGGFQSVDSVSALVRLLNQSPVAPVVELTFGGKLRGEKADEMFMGRLAMVQSGTQLAFDQNGNPLPFMDLTPTTFEQLSATSDAGTYRSRGVDYDTNSPIHLVQVTPAGTAANPGIPTWTNLLMDGWGDPNFNDPNGPWDAAVNYNAANNTMAVDRATGVISYDTRLGGKVYIDPALGTVKFSGGQPSPAAIIKLSYQARFIRISDTAGAYSSPSGLFDTRTTSDPLDLTNPQGKPASFVWRKADSGSNAYGDDWLTLADITSQQNATGTGATNDRYVFTYNRAAGGAGQASRPYMTTRRMGVKLQYPIYVAPTGLPGYVQVLWYQNGNWVDPSPVHYYQIDPVNGKIYFQGIDEGALVLVKYQAADATTGQPLKNGANGLITPGEIIPVAQITETAESPVLMNSPVNESGLDTFLDPFNYPQELRRPPLMWLFWTSTRNGTPDIYFETLSPMLIPRPNGLNQ